MEKMFKIIAMLLLVAAVVCVAGCSSKNNANTTQSTVADNNVTESTASAQVTPDNSTDVNATDNNTASQNVTDNNSSPVANTTIEQNVTQTPENTSTPAINVGTAQRNRAIILSRMNGSTDANTDTNTTNNTSQ
jgi:hypothetical protein